MPHFSAPDHQLPIMPTTEIKETKGKIFSVQIARQFRQRQATVEQIRHKATITEYQKEQLVFNREEYVQLVEEGNALQRRGFEQYKEHALAIHLKDRKPALYIFKKCSDGRTDDLARFSGMRPEGFASEKLALAGCKMNGTLDTIATDKDPMRRLNELFDEESRKSEKNELFKQFEHLLGNYIREKLLMRQGIIRAAECAITHSDEGKCLQNIQNTEQRAMVAELLKSKESALKYAQKVARENLGYKDKRISLTDEQKNTLEVETKKLLQEKLNSLLTDDALPVVLEDISHGPYQELSGSAHTTSKDAQDATHADHTHDGGCGAWLCNTGNALNGTMVNAIALERWIQEQYPADAKHIRIVRTHHLTGDQERIVDPNKTDLVKKMNPRLREIMKNRFDPIDHFDDEPAIVRKPQTEKPHNRHDRENHSEPIIILSDTLQATALPYISRLEQSLPEDENLALGVCEVLIGIATRNYISLLKNAGIEQPLFVHIDVPKDNPERAAYYKKVYSILHERFGKSTDPKITFILSETSGKKLVDPENTSLRTRIIGAEDVEQYLLKQAA